MPGHRKALAAWIASLLAIGACATDARADGNDAMQWLRTGDCKRAGVAINDGIGRDEAKAYMLAGYMYAVTGCVEPDLPRAARYYQRAAELGDNDARTYLGIMYGLGNGVPQDYRIAYRWFTYGQTLLEPLDAGDEIAVGYANTVTQIARSQVEYPRFVGDEGTVFVTFHSAARTVTFSPHGTGNAPHRTLARATPFTQAIATAYENAVRAAPEPAGLPTRDVVFEVPWTFLRR